MLDGRYVVLYVQHQKVLVFNVLIRIVEHHFMYVFFERCFCEYHASIAKLCCVQKKKILSFQVTCGLSAGYFLDVQQTSSDSTASSRSQFNAYCLKHSEEARQRSEPDYSSIPHTDDENSYSSLSIPLTVYHRQTLKIDQWTSKCYENFHTFISSSHLNTECPQDYDEYLSEKISNYWKTKRIANENLPLIKRIDLVLEQRENAELLLAQINNCLKTRKKIRQVIPSFFRFDEEKIRIFPSYI